MRISHVFLLHVFFTRPEYSSMSICASTFAVRLEWGGLNGWVSYCAGVVEFVMRNAVPVFL